MNSSPVLSAWFEPSESGQASAVVVDVMGETAAEDRMAGLGAAIEVGRSGLSSWQVSGLKKRRKRTRSTIIT